MGATGVLLLNLGGPDRPASVKPFLRELFSDPEVLAIPGGAPARKALAWWIATRRAKRVIANYLEVGWSPLLQRTLAQQRALEARLNERAGASTDSNSGSPPFLVRTAMRYWHPRATPALDELLAAGISSLVLLPLYPQYSRATTASSLGELRPILARRAPQLPVSEVTSYATDSAYVAALARCVEEGIAAARAERSEHGEPVLLFSAHGLPLRLIENGDPYETEVRATKTAVLKRLDWKGEVRLSFQSRAGPVKWLEPSTEATIADLARAGFKSIVVVPISFVSDHIETVHEIDLLLGRQARAHGVKVFVRTPALDARPDFIDALAALTEECTRRMGAAAGQRAHVARAR
jgi:ferrochelatase